MKSKYYRPAVRRKAITPSVVYIARTENPDGSIEDIASGINQELVEQAAKDRWALTGCKVWAFNATTLAPVYRKERAARVGEIRTKTFVAGGEA